MKQAATLLLVVLLIAPLFVAVASQDATEGANAMQDIEPTISFEESMMASRNIRVAIYDESNITVPTGSHASGLTNNVSEVAALLTVAGYQVTHVTTEDILDHKLKTAFYDVFIMVNNLPRESISKLVKDFWLGGGGLLTFHGALSYLYYESIIIPEWDYDVGYELYWGYFSSDDQNVTARHSTMKDYHIGDVVTERSNLWATAWERVLIGTLGFEDEATKADDFTILMNNGNTPDFITAFSIDNSHVGGRVVQLPGDGNSIPAAFESIITDSVDWLAPRPKARILYDLTHDPWLPSDPWDGGYQPFYLSALRDGLVNRSYTVDKLHPSAEGNFTAENLAPYDMLIINQPMVNLTPQDISAVEQWVDDGGGLFVVGDNAGVPDNYRLNELISPYGIQFNHTPPTYSGTFTDFDMHPTTEGCTSLTYQGAARLNVSGDAYPIWNYTSGDIAVAASEYGNGRVLVIPDANSVVEPWILNADNFQFDINVANWLTAGEVLLYTTEPFSSNYYRSPAATALNELGIPFHLTFDADYMNLSLSIGDWDLVVLDGPYFSMSGHYGEILEFVTGGGKIIMSEYQADSYPSNPLWAALGFEIAGEMPDSSPIHIWDTMHSVFNQPTDYGVLNFTPTVDYGDDGDLLTVFANATAIAGFTTDSQDGNATIVLRNDGMTLYNAYLIDEFQGDLDDSTFMDAFELWLNEIAFMSQPNLNAPSDLEYVEGTTGHSIVWTPHSLHPAQYVIEIDGVPDASATWDGGLISHNVDGHANGTYEYTITVYDNAGYTALDEVIVTVLEAPPTSTTTEPPPLPPLDPTILIIIAAGAGVVIIIVIIIFRKRGAE